MPSLILVVSGEHHFWKTRSIRELRASTWAVKPSILRAAAKRMSFRRSLLPMPWFWKSSWIVNAHSAKFVVRSRS